MFGNATWRLIRFDVTWCSQKIGSKNKNTPKTSKNNQNIKHQNRGKLIRNNFWHAAYGVDQKQEKEIEGTEMVDRGSFMWDRQFFSMIHLPNRKKTWKRLSKYICVVAHSNLVFVLPACVRAQFQHPTLLICRFGPHAKSNTPGRTWVGLGGWFVGGWTGVFLDACTNHESGNGWFMGWWERRKGAKNNPSA